MIGQGSPNMQHQHPTPGVPPQQYVLQTEPAACLENPLTTVSCTSYRTYSLDHAHHNPWYISTVKCLSRRAHPHFQTPHQTMLILYNLQAILHLLLQSVLLSCQDWHNVPTCTTQTPHPGIKGAVNHAYCNRDPTEHPITIQLESIPRPVKMTWPPPH